MTKKIAIFIFVLAVVWVSLSVKKRKDKQVAAPVVTTNTAPSILKAPPKHLFIPISKGLRNVPKAAETQISDIALHQKLLNSNRDREEESKEAHSKLLREAIDSPTLSYIETLESMSNEQEKLEFIAQELASLPMEDKSSREFLLGFALRFEDKALVRNLAVEEFSKELHSFDPVQDKYLHHLIYVYKTKKDPSDAGSQDQMLGLIHSLRDEDSYQGLLNAFNRP